MFYHRKREKQLRAEQERCKQSITDHIEKDLGEDSLRFPKSAPVRVHRLLLYSGLSLQEAPAERRLVARNGMKVADLASLEVLAGIAGVSLREFGEMYAAF